MGSSSRSTDAGGVQEGRGSVGIVYEAARSLKHYLQSVMV